MNEKLEMAKNSLYNANEIKDIKENPVVESVLLAPNLKLGAGALSVAGAEVGILQLVSGGVALQAVPAVAAQEWNGQANALSLGQDLAHVLIVEMCIRDRLNDLRKRMDEGKHLKLEVTTAAKDFIIDSAYDSVYGARPIKRFIQSLSLIHI